jgi:hypothetical protein
MAGKRGRSGRKRGSGMTAEEHARRGTYRPSVHGPLPPGVIPLPRRPVLSSVAALPPATPSPFIRPGSGIPQEQALGPEDCPDFLTAEGKQEWRTLVRVQPTDRKYAHFVCIYIEAMLAWKRATLEVQAKGDYGKLGTKAVPNPFLRLRREAEATMLTIARSIGWLDAPAPAVQAPAEPQKSRLELFLAQRSRA